jgi:hypothetical protein
VWIKAASRGMWEGRDYRTKHGQFFLSTSARPVFFGTKGFFLTDEEVLVYYVPRFLNHHVLKPYY